MAKTTFSIVTIVYNDWMHIISTINSIINQSYKEIECLIIDGRSTDGTIQTILNHFTTIGKITLKQEDEHRLYLEGFILHSPSISFKILSEKDRGIYDAMNKGIALATKEWINFMNCGDRFYDTQVLQKISQSMIETYDIIYGDTEIFYLDQKTSLLKYAPNHLKNSLRQYGNNLIHQSCFFKTRLHQLHHYAFLKYQIASDYELIYKLFSLGYKFYHLHFPVSIFSTGGTSDQKAFKRNKECFLISLSYNKNIFYNFYYFAFATLKKFIKLYCPNLSKMIIKNLKNQSPPQLSLGTALDNTPFFSIIIPVFNTENFLDQTICSCINQTFKNIEIIIIDDHSTDHSKTIIQKYAQIDSRIKAFYNLNNIGVFHTRSFGLSYALGKYILFVDSDDFIAQNTCAIIYASIKNQPIDILHYRMSRIPNYFTSIAYNYAGSLTSNQQIINFFDKSKYFQSQCDKAFSLEIIKKAYEILSNLIEPPLNSMEDGLIVLISSFYSKSYLGINTRLYFYQKNSKSLTRTLSEENIKRKIKDYLKLFKILQIIKKSYPHQYHSILAFERKILAAFILEARFYNSQILQEIIQYLLDLDIKCFIAPRFLPNFIRSCLASYYFLSRWQTVARIGIYLISFTKIKL